MTTLTPPQREWLDLLEKKLRTPRKRTPMRVSGKSVLTILRVSQGKNKRKQSR